VYIGKSKNILSRYYKYFNLKCIGQQKIYRSLKKYGPENHVFDVIEECDVALLIEREIYHKTQFINEHTWNKALFCHLVDGESGPHIQTETSNKMRSKSLKEYWEDKTHPLSGRPLPPNVIEKRLKPVLQYSLDGDFIREWESQLDVYNNLGVDINNCLKQRYKTSGKFQWLYKEQTILSKIEPVKPKMERTQEHSDKIAKNKIGKGLKPIIQVDMDGNIIKEWESQSQASVETNIPIACINLCLNGKSKTSGGYKWIYKN
jgi:group I intron endonuclease